MNEYTYHFRIRASNFYVKTYLNGDMRADCHFPANAVKKVVQHMAGGTWPAGWVIEKLDSVLGTSQRHPPIERAKQMAYMLRAIDGDQIVVIDGYNEE